MQALTYFGSNHVGCWADGCYGHEHVRDVLAGLVESIVRGTFRQPLTADLVSSLRGPMPDDGSDEDEAIEFLQGFTADGLVWTFEAGDLILTSEDQLD